MQSKKSYFNFGIFRNTLKRFWPLWAAYAFILFILLPLSIIGNQNIEYYQVSGRILESGWSYGTITSFVMAAATAMCVFGFLYSPRHTGLVAALPVSREAVFVSAFSAGLAAVIASDLLIAVITVIAEAQIGLLAISYLIKWLGIIVMMNITFYGFAAFCAMLTGNIIVLPAVYGVLSITAVGFEYLVKSLLKTFIYGMTEGSSIFMTLSPFVKLLNESPYVNYADYTAGQAVTTTAITSEQWGLLGIYCASGVIFAILALAIYRRRRMETATDVVAIKILKPVFKYCMTAGCALVMGVWLYAVIFGESYRPMAAYIVAGFMLVGAFIGYYAAEMLMKKTFRVFSGNWKCFVVSCCVIIVFIVCFNCDFFGYEKHVPELDDIECAVVSVDGETATFHSAQNIAKTVAVHQSVIANKAENMGSDVGGFVILRVNYQLKNGGALIRSYNLPDDDEHYNDPDSNLSAVEDLLNVQESIDSRKQTRVAVNEKNISFASISFFDSRAGEYVNYDLTPAQAAELYTSCIVPDIADGSLGRIWIHSSDEYYEKVYALDISIELYDRTNSPVTDADDFSGADYDYFQTTLTVDAVHTLQWLSANTDITPVMLRDMPNNSQEAMGITDSQAAVEKAESVAVG